MSGADSLKEAFRPEKRPSRREERAARERAKALSPARILLRLLGLPILAAGIATSIYIRTSPYDPPDAMRHLIARAGCDAARTVALAPAFRGQLGYHAHNDENGDGIACEGRGFSGTAMSGSSTDRVRRANGAKFVKP